MDAVQISLTGIYLGQIAAVVLAVRAIGGEYDSAMIRTTLAAMPRRLTLLIAKAGVLVVTVLAVATVALAATLAVARTAMPNSAPTNGYALLSLADEPTRRAYLGTIVYIGLIALLSLGIATTLRHTGASITTTLGLLYLTPILALFITDPRWQHRVHRYSPMTAGLTVQDTTTVSGHPAGGWSGLGVLAAYAAAAVITGAILLCRRDA